MREAHITDILDRGSLARLSESDTAMIRAHVEKCAACSDAYEAARISEELIRERASESVDPSPFFQTRVMAAWRERQESSAASGLGRLWKSAGALVSSMGLVTAAMAVLSLTIPGPATQTTEATADLLPTSAETVVLNTEEYEGPLSDEQLWSAIYPDEEEAK